MDRKIIYPGQIPLETDLLGTNVNAMIALGKLAGAIFGTGGMVNGLAVSPNSPAALNVIVGAGEIYQLANVDNTAYSSLPADTTNTCVKQGILLQPTVLACPAPSTAGFSINYLIEATFAESDGGSQVLPYYNASNPAQAYSGPNNTGASQSTVRAGIVSLQVKPGVAATTGTQVTPAVDAGYIALAVVTVANGQTSVVAGNIVAANGAQFVASPVASGRLINVQTFATAGTFTYNPTQGTKKVRVTVVGGGGGGGGVAATGAGQVAGGAGGSGGGFAQGLLTSGFAGVSVVVGSGGAGGPAGNNSGTTGGTSSFGAALSATGGPGALGAPAAASGITGGLPGGSGVSGNIVNGTGGTGGFAFSVTTVAVIAGYGGSSLLAGNTQGKGAVASGTSFAGIAGAGPGGGGGGACASNSASAQAGGNGAQGMVIVEELG